MKQEHTPHILTTASNLMGFCFIVATYLNTSNISQKGPIEDLVGIATIVFAVSCLTSFLSMKSRQESRMERYELIADIFFFCGMAMLILVIGGGFFWFF